MAKAHKDSNGKLDKAMAALVEAQATPVQNQAALVKTQQSFVEQMADLERETAEVRRRSDEEAAKLTRDAEESNRRIAELQRRADERFARIEAILIEHPEISDVRQRQIDYAPTHKAIADAISSIWSSETWPMRRTNRFSDTDLA
jgi:hypothetical protein